MSNQFVFIICQLFIHYYCVYLQYTQKAKNFICNEKSVNFQIGHIFLFSFHTLHKYTSNEKTFVI
jgi:hypothetical protein